MSKGLLFSGQGAQKVGMGKSLVEGSEIAKAIYAKADEVLGWDVPLSQICFEGPEETLTETRVCQPALYVMGYAIFKILEEQGKLEGLSLAAGLSLGELTALAVAESFSFEDGLRVVAERGRLMQEACDASDGAMASMIGGSLEAVHDLCLAHDVDMANLNCPGQIVISGESAKVAEAVKAGKESGGFRMVVPLKVAGAYHSRLMQPAKEKFEAFLNTVEIREPKLTVLSNTTGKAVKTPDQIRTALSKQVVASVLWEHCLREMLAMDVTDLFECGPGGALAGMAKRTDRGLKVTPIAEFSDLG